MPDEYKLFRESVRRFVDNEIKPYAQEFEDRKEFPMPLFKKIAKMGYFGIRYPEEVGGSSGTAAMFNILCEELARGYMSIAAITAMQCLMGTNFIFKYGTKNHHDNYLKPAIRGEKIATFALTEPDAGSDLSNIKSIAERKGDRFIINGSKTWITNSSVADFFTVLCLTDREKRLKGANFFLIPKEVKGLTVSKKFDKIGTKSAENSEIFLSNVEVPIENMLGQEGKGMSNLLQILSEIRTMTAALSLGLLRAAFEESRRYSKQRVQFGKPIGSFQLIQSKLANMATDIEVSKCFLYKVSKMIDNGEKCEKEASMAKYFISEAACRAVDQATRIFGSYGFSSEYPVGRFFTDSRFLLFGGGTSEILQNNIAREILEDN